MITRHSRTPVALRFALRELRGSLKNFRIFMACLILGVAAIASVASLTQAIEEGLAREGQNILGGDIEIRLFQRKADPSLADFVADKGTLSNSARLRTMARAQTSGKSTLVELRGVDSFYPLYGALTTTPQLDNDALFKKRGETWGVAIDPLLAQRLGVDVGDRLTFGAVTTDIRALIDNEPDKANLGFQLGPSVMIRMDAIEESGLITVGSLVDYYYKVRLNDPLAVQAFRDQLEEAYPEESWRVRDRSRSAPGLRRFIDQMGMFLTLVGLAALIVGGVGVGNAVRGYMDRKTKTIATFKILGADGNTIFATYFIQVMLIGVIAIIAGLTLGAMLPGTLATFLPDTLPVKPDQGVYPLALALAATYGLLITIAFTVWPLGVARDLPAVHLFRSIVTEDTRRPRRIYLAMIALAALFTGLLAVLLSGNKMLAAGFLAGAIGAIALLKVTSALIQKLAARIKGVRSPLVRMAIANLHRPGAATGAVVISLGLGLTLFASLALIEGNLGKQLQEEVPSEAPAFFIIDIQPWQVDDFKNAAASIDGVSDIIMVPSLRGRVVKINDTPAAEWTIPDSRFRWILNGDRGLSYNAELPHGSYVTDGDWWPEEYAGPPEISFGKEEAEGLGVKIGDTITVSVLGREITATIRSLRQIEWGSMGFNFVMLFDPNTLKAAPHTFMATLKADTQTEEIAHAALTQQFENITAIRMKEVLSTVNTLLEQIGIAVRATALVAIIAGVFVLAGAIAAGFRQRVYESVILKVVGAVRSQILRAYLLEYMMIGLITSAIAIGLGCLAGYVVVAQVMDMTFTLLPAPVVITVCVSLFVTILFGLGSSFRALSVKPNEALRNE
ncbi:glycosyl transferase family 1 [Kordiimonas sediminis]|uniref:Glycosyl transferase family 1 n=1 Tax=Kordiimonas sediminis TaxID=1735581 RepID=A0A919ALV2_9PROT|nr:FtsX-like permease family protein [Kordiimonas sediminis]GHF12047.1 glycosyl transferase family 1 [Kordiimonas sediminis]